MKTIGPFASVEEGNLQATLEAIRTCDDVVVIVKGVSRPITFTYTDAVEGIANILLTAKRDMEKLREKTRVVGKKRRAELASIFQRLEAAHETLLILTKRAGIQT